MSNSTKIVAGLCIAAFAAACAPKEKEVVYVEPEPVQTEDSMQKY